MAVVLAALVVSACQILPAPAPQPRVATQALAEFGATSLGRIAASEEREHPGLSGFELVEEGIEAFGLTHAFISRAERTLDAQYYIWRNDASGRVLLSELVAAADRGVRVRLLLDDLEVPTGDFDLAALNLHPNIDVRLFNPFIWREFRLANLLLDLPRITHRMHNKVMIADNAVALTGGRNVGDQYATIHPSLNYRDLDLLVAGPVVRELSDAFDAYWNSPWSISVSSLLNGAAPGPDALPTLLRGLDRLIARDGPHPFADSAARAASRLPDTIGGLIWAPSTLAVDPPDKAETKRSEVLEAARRELGGKVERDMLIETAYFIPGPREVEHYCALVAAGVRVRILTNSLASTDSVSAGAAYRPYRRPLVACGVQIYEMRRHAAIARERWIWAGPAPAASLHSKAGVFDGRLVFVGSYNLDPRSRNLNTELALFIDSPALAAETTAFIEESMRPENAYRVVLGLDGALRWISLGPDGRPEIHAQDPDTGPWRDFKAAILSLFPEEQL